MMFGVGPIMRWLPRLRRDNAERKAEPVSVQVERLIADIADRRRQHKPTRSQIEQLRALRVAQIQREIHP